MNYEKLPDLELIYLEDSFVVKIHENPDSIIFDLEAVLMKEHFLYSDPLPGEQHCYRMASLFFLDAYTIEWKKRNLKEYVDLSGEIDYGNIDYFNFESDLYKIGGSWGDLIIKCKSIKFEIK